MTVSELGQALELTAFAAPEPYRRITGGYAGDLLSWVMGRARSGDAWITIMSNQNIVAVAVLADAALIRIDETGAIMAAPPSQPEIILISKSFTAEAFITPAIVPVPTRRTAIGDIFSRP